MTAERIDLSHDHRAWQGQVRPENCEPGTLHRHRVIDRVPGTRFTTWAHDTPQHTHRLPDGAWTDHRRSLTQYRPVP